jgi:hypothetical protein
MGRDHVDKHITGQDDEGDDSLSGVLVPVG